MLSTDAQSQEQFLCCLQHLPSSDGSEPQHLLLLPWLASQLHKPRQEDPVDQGILRAIFLLLKTCTACARKKGTLLLQALERVLLLTWLSGSTASNEPLLLQLLLDKATYLGKEALQVRQSELHESFSFFEALASSVNEQPDKSAAWLPPAKKAACDNFAIDDTLPVATIIGLRWRFAAPPAQMMRCECAIVGPGNTYHGCFCWMMDKAIMPTVCQPWLLLEDPFTAHDSLTIAGLKQHSSCPLTYVRRCGWG